MKIITFHKEFKELILNGRKTETRRINKYVKVGDILLAKVGRTGKAFAELKVMSFKREKLQEISCQDIRNEGYNLEEKYPLNSLFGWFYKIWNSINKKPGIHFEDNPVVSVIKFKLFKTR